MCILHHNLVGRWLLSCYYSSAFVKCQLNMYVRVLVFIVSLTFPLFSVSNIIYSWLWKLFALQGWIDGSVAKSGYYSCRGSDTQIRELRITVTSTLFWTPHIPALTLTCTNHTQACTHVDIIKINKKKLVYLYSSYLHLSISILFFQTAQQF